MESAMKQRLVGAAVLVALAVIFLPMLVQGPAPESGVSNVPLTMPPAPRGDIETRELPLVTPGDTPAGGAVGMPAAVPADRVPAAATVVASTPISVPPAASASTPSVAKVPSTVAATVAPLPAAAAGGDYAVAFGAYASSAAADTVIASLRSTQLPAYREPTTSGGKPAWRVRIGPFATRAEAESARLRAAHVRDDVGAQVVVLDGPPSTAASPTQTAAKPTTPAKTTAASAQQPTTASAKTPTASIPTPKPPAASATGFAVQLAAYSKAGDATALRDRLRAAGFSAFTESVATDKGTLTRVRVGPVANRSDAEQLQAQVKAKLGLGGIVRPHP